MAETTDCISIVCSEETGRLSIAVSSELHYNLTIDEIKLMLLEELRPKKSLILDDEDEEGDNDEDNVQDN